MSATYEPTVSVIVPAYNAESTIDECVRSLLDLEYPPDKLELRVVDNDSSDDTVKALRRFGEDVVLLREPKRGAAAARNAGLAGASGEVVAFTDADCAVDPDWLRNLVVPLRDHKVGVTGGTILARRPANDVELFGEVIHDHRKAIEVSRPPYVLTGSWASRTEVLRRLGGFDERFRRCQDADLSFRVVESGLTLTFVPDAVVYHRNEATLSGLFREGFVHGYHSVHARRRHESFLRQFGLRRVDRQAYANIGARLLDWARGRDASRSRCDAVFNSGKKAGKLLGSIRFRSLDL